jgi:glycerol uptake facilitator-like aquaporin
VVFKGFIAAATSVALMASPAVASAAETASTARAATTEVAPAGENVQGNELRGGFIIPLIALIAIILGILAATKNKKTRTSP